MAKMGTGKLARKHESGEGQLPSAGFPEVMPVNLITSPIESVPVTAVAVGTDHLLGGTIMREGFTIDTGLFPSSSNINGQ